MSKRRGSSISEDMENRPSPKRLAMEADDYGENSRPAEEQESEETHHHPEKQSRRPVSSHRMTKDQPDTYVHLRILVTSRESVTVIGRGGESIARIRESARVRLNVSENIPGATERVINVKGQAEFVAKAAGLIVRTLYNEPFDEPSLPDAKSFPMRILMPNQIMGALIGKQGSKFREIEDASAAKLRAHDQILPGSNDRYLIVNGVSDAVHIAVYYICLAYIQNKDRLLRDSRLQPYDPGAYHMKHQHMHHQPYLPPPSQSPSESRPILPYGAVNSGLAKPLQPYGNLRYHENPGMTSTSSAPPPPPPPPTTDDPIIKSAQEEAKQAPQDQELTQYIRIPKDSIGCVIGRGGNQIKGIRNFSGSQVRVSGSDQDNEKGERLITIQGTPACNQVALYLISTRIEASRRNYSTTSASTSSTTTSTTSTNTNDEGKNVYSPNGATTEAKENDNHDDKDHDGAAVEVKHD